MLLKKSLLLIFVLSFHSSFVNGSTTEPLPFKNIVSLEDLNNFEKYEGELFKKTKINSKFCHLFSKFVLQLFTLSFLMETKQLFVSKEKRETLYFHKAFAKLAKKLSTLGPIEPESYWTFSGTLEKELLKCTAHNFRDDLRLLWSAKWHQKTYARFYEDPDNNVYKKIRYPCQTNFFLKPPDYSTEKGLSCSDLVPPTSNPSFNLLSIVAINQQNKKPKIILETSINSNGPSFHQYNVFSLSLYATLLALIKSKIPNESSNASLIKMIDQYLTLFSLRFLMVFSPEAQQFYKESEALRNLLKNSSRQPLETFLKKLKETSQNITHKGFQLIVNMFPWEDSLELGVNCHPENKPLKEAPFHEPFLPWLEDFIAKNELAIKQHPIQMPQLPLASQTIHRMSKQLLTQTLKHVEQKREYSSKTASHLAEKQNALSILMDKGFLLNLWHYFYQPLNPSKFPTSQPQTPPLIKKIPFHQPTAKIDELMVKNLFKYCPQSFLSFNEKNIPKLVQLMLNEKKEKNKTSSSSSDTSYFFSFGGMLQLKKDEDEDPLNDTAIQENPYRIIRQYASSKQDPFVNGLATVINRKGTCTYKLIPMAEIYPIDTLFSQNHPALAKEYTYEHTLNNVIKKLLTSFKLSHSEYFTIAQKAMDELALLFALSMVNARKGDLSLNKNSSSFLSKIEQLFDNQPLSLTAQNAYSAFKQKHLDPTIFLTDPHFMLLQSKSIEDWCIVIRTYVGTLYKLEKEASIPTKPNLVNYYKQLFEKLCKTNLKGTEKLKEANDVVQTLIKENTGLKHHQKQVLNLRNKLNELNQKCILTFYSILDESGNIAEVVHLNDGYKKLADLEKRIEEASKTESIVLELSRSINAMSSYSFPGEADVFVKTFHNFMTPYRALFQVITKNISSWNALVGPAEGEQLLCLRDLIFFKSISPEIVSKYVSTSNFLWKHIDQLFFKDVHFKDIHKKREGFALPFAKQLFEKQQIMILKEKQQSSELN